MIMCYPVMTKGAAEDAESFKNFKGRRKIDVIYSDKAGELIAATRSVGAEHQPSLTGIPKSNAIV